MQAPRDARTDLDKLEDGAEFPAADGAASPQSRLLFQSRFVDALGATGAIRIGLTEYYLINSE